MATQDTLYKFRALKPLEYLRHIVDEARYLLERKTKAWTYEKEVRAINKEEYLRFAKWKVRMSRMLLGVRTPREVQELIRKITPSTVPVLTTAITDNNEITVDKEIPCVAK